jgi:hypothetical protein
MRGLEWDNDHWTWVNPQSGTYDVACQVFDKGNWGRWYTLPDYVVS